MNKKYLEQYKLLYKIKPKYGASSVKFFDILYSMLEKEKKVSSNRQCDDKEINTAELQKQSRQLTSEKMKLSDKIKLKDFLGIQKFDTEKLREVIKVIRVHSQDEIEIEWNFDDIFSEQR